MNRTGLIKPRCRAGAEWGIRWEGGRVSRGTSPKIRIVCQNRGPPDAGRFHTRPDSNETGDLSANHACFTQSDKEELRKEIGEGLLYVHTRVADNAKRTAEAASFVYGLIELLSEKGLVSIEEIDERKRVIAERLVKQTRERGMGVLLQDPEIDKYASTEMVAIDCENRVHLCQAACCKLPFALSKQDVHEGVIHWDLGQPYMIAQGANGYCTHLESGARRCTVREQRPLPCRAYDCRKDKKIWLDFEKHIINPDILRPDWPRCAGEQNGHEGDL